MKSQGVNDKIKVLQTKLKSKQQKIRRLKKKINCLKDVVEDLSDKKLISQSQGELLNSKYSGVSSEIFTRMKLVRNKKSESGIMRQ